ncbi:MAG: formylglycine-generating enzyme family protein [Gemmataceae bacterium]|nr:formylglycine-generating enzyme family protein [Gemmataceae bacterium]
MLPRALALFPVLAVAAGLSAPAADQAPAAKPPAKANYTEAVKAVRVIEHEEMDPKTKAKTKRIEKVPLAAKFDMVYVPGGEFTMGSPEGEAGREPIEGPQHRVKVGGFWMGKCEVTWDVYDVFWFDGDHPVANEERAKGLGPDAVTRPTNTFVDETYDHGREGHPALCMSHHGAMAFCNWLRAKTGKAYRLPTEAEWEYAARGGKGDAAYFFGDDPADLDEYAWYKNNSVDEENFPDKIKGCTHKVGTRKPNPFGLHDLYGNVWEWTLDQYDPKAYERFAAQKLSLNPVTLPTADKWSHVVRGGSWADKADRCRSAARRVSEKSWMKWDPQEPQSIWWLTRMDVIGFRVVIAEDEQPELVGLKPKVVKKSE